MTFWCILYSITRCGIGIATNTATLVVFICIFSFSARILTIALNTQAITLQKLFDRKINGSFHGLWSTGGIVGVGVTTLIISQGISITPHLVTVSVITILITLFASRFLLRNDRAATKTKQALAKPDA